MKKSILTLVGICFLIFSCQSELIEDLEGDSLSFSTSSSHKSSQAQVNCEPDLEALELSLPAFVTASTTAKPGVDSYFTLSITEQTESDINLIGIDIPAWCVDQDLSLGIEGPLQFAVYSSYEALPDGEFEFPENFDLVNWVLNQDYVGKVSPNGGTYTFGHVQYAMWLLVDDLPCSECRYLTDPIMEWNDDSENNIAKSQEIEQAARDNGENFVPGCGQKVAVILNPAGKQAIIITVDVPEKEIECQPCKGKVTELELQYNGDVPAYIEVKTKEKKRKKRQDPIDRTVFEGTVAPGETFSFIGNDDKGTLGTEITIYVNGEVDQKIHTSCSVPIGPGAVFGDYTVVSGSSREGGELCPATTPPDEDCSECKGKVTELVMQYDGSVTANIIVETKKKKPKKGQDPIDRTVFEGTVAPGETFSFIGNDDKGTLGTEITIYVNGEVDQKIHTSCSVPIGPGAVFGDYTVVSGSSREGGELCPATTPPESEECDCDGKIVKMSVIYDGPSGAEVVVTGDKGGSQTFSNVQNGATLTAELGNVGVWWYYSVNGSDEAKIHTSCSDDILGNVDAHKSMFGNNGSYPDPVDGDDNGTFLVTSHTDEKGNTCSIDVGGH